MLETQTSQAHLGIGSLTSPRQVLATQVVCRVAWSKTCLEPSSGLRLFTSVPADRMAAAIGLHREWGLAHGLILHRAYPFSLPLAVIPY